MRLPAWGFLALALCFIAPAASFPVPALYFMGDAPTGPASAGVLLVPVPGLVPNTTSPQARPVVPAVPGSPVQFAAFVTPAGLPHADRLKGYLFIGLWTGASPTVHGNVSATVSEETAAGALVPLGSASVAVDANASRAPAPTSLVPPNPTPDPSTPQGWATSQVVYEAAQALPVILQPPNLLKIGPLDHAFNATSRLVISFTLVPAPGGPVPVGSPVPQGAAATLQYNYTLDPSFVYVPWYAADPVANPPGHPTSSAAPSSESTSSPPPTTSAKGSPGPDVVLVACALLLLARRR
ncbi:MAG: hypothetical protein ACYDBQ_01620 [Thermoplasmatota archaeon]